MTKRNLLLVSFLLVFGLLAMATSALAQTQWTQGVSLANGDMRNEGLAESTGIVSVDNYTTGNVSGGSYFILTYSSNGSPVPIVPGSWSLSCAGTAGPFVGGSCAAVTASIPNPVTQPNVLHITFNGPKTTLYNFSTLNSSISVVVRVNATKIKCATPNLDVVVTSYSSISPGDNITVQVPGGPQAVGSLGSNLTTGACEPALSLTFANVVTRTRHSDTYTSTPGVAADVLSCIGVHDVGTYENQFCLNVDEEFAHALTSESYEDSLDPDATTGTSVDIVFTGVPTGVGIRFESTTPCYELATVDPNSCNNVPAGYTGTLTLGLDPSGCSANLSGTVTCIFDVTSVDNGNAENVNLCFRFWSSGQLPPGLPEIYADLYKDPVVPGSAIPIFTGAYELPLPGLSVVDFSDCWTFLLYPYVTDIYGYDTGLTVSNTTLDPFNIPSAADSPSGPNPLDLQPQYGKGTAVPQTGPCQFYIYANGATPWYATFPTPSVLPGQSFSFLLSVAAPGTNGYAIAVCAFQNAHGQATIQYSIGAGGGFETGYLADILGNPQWFHRSPAGRGYGETSIIESDPARIPGHHH